MTLLQYIGEWVGWKMIKVRRDVIEYVEEHGSGGSQTFLGLTDTPSSYTDQSGKGVKVNTPANGLMFYTIIDTFKDLKDVPVYTGNALKFLRIKSDESGVEWVTSDAPLYGSDTQIPYMYHGNYGYSGSFTFDEPNNKLSVINIGCISIMTDAVQASGAYYICLDNELFQDGDIKLYQDNGFKIGVYLSEEFGHLCKLMPRGISIGYKTSEPYIDNYSILIGSCINANDRENIAIGYDIANNIGRSNILIGNNIGNVGNSTVSIGYYSGQNSTGSNNIFLGYSAGKNQTTLSDLLIIDNQDRGTAANEQTKSMFYGVFGADISSQTLRINAKTGIGKSSSSVAYLSLPAGTTTVAPMKIESGSLLTTPQIGAFEFWGGRFYLTDGNPTRKIIAWNPMTASGDIIYGGANGVETRLAKGTNGQVLTLVSGLPAWQTPSTITYGSQYQIPVTNAGGTGFSYSSYFTYGFTIGQIVKSSHANIISEFYKTDGSGNTVNKIAIADSISGSEIGLVYTLNNYNYIISAYDDNNNLFSYCNGGLVSDFFNIGSYYNMNIIDEAKIYLAQNISSDVLNDLRFYNNSGVFTVEKCTVANDAKGHGTWKTFLKSLDAFTALTVQNNASTWDCYTGLNKTVSISANWGLTISNFENGMFGDLKVTVTEGTPDITLTASGVTFKGNGNLLDLANGIYHLCWVCSSSSTIEYNIALYE